MSADFRARLHAWWKSLFPAGSSPTPPPGLYPFSRTKDGRTDRLHLRVDPDGHGTLLLNANRFLHLNPTACMLAYHYLNGTDQPALARQLRENFHVSLPQAEEDVQHLTTDLERFIRADGKPFFAESALEIERPFSRQPRAPYRMDLALTYRCNNDCPHCYNARERSFPELDTQAWINILDRLWSQAIPHVVFTGGEPTLRKDLPDLIQYAEGKGLITGLNSHGRRLADPQYLEQLVQAGLDHVQITLESHDPQVHNLMVHHNGAWEETVQGIKNALDSPLYVMTNTTMLQDNRDTVAETLDFLAQIGVPTVGLNALIYAGKGQDVGTGLPDSELPDLLNTARRKTSAAGQRLIWYTPTQYCRFNPLDMELGVKGCTAALYNMCVEPNGDVLPCQSYYQALGNILHDPWDSIWLHPLAANIRDRKYAPQVCRQCDLFPECGGGCPLALSEYGEPANPDRLLPLNN